MRRPNAISLQGSWVSPPGVLSENRAASLVERMEKDGLVGPANHVGKREILSGNREREPAPADFSGDDD